MAGAWRKTLMYLGLVEDDEALDAHPGRRSPQPAEAPAPPRLRRVATPEPVATGSRGGGSPSLPATDPGEAIVRTIPQRSQASAIHRAEPKRFNEARDLGEKYRQGVPVIMNLQATDDTIARRLVDFASGLVFGLDGKIELVANRVYLLTPQDMEVSAEERERLREGGFYNQF